MTEDKRSLFYEELYCQAICESKPQPNIDILIVIRDQYDYIKKCIESLMLYTTNFNLYLWDNGSESLTANFLAETSKGNNVKLIRKEENHGFIIPNNRLVELGDSPYIILLNSDTEVRQGWSTALIGYLMVHPEIAEVGYYGCTIDAYGRGFPAWCGKNIDFIPGWCVCLRRETYEKLGLFDETNLNFAYGEDSDLSLRIKESGKDIYALHLDLVVHFGNKTISQVQHERDVASTFSDNHAYIRRRWADYLTNQRVSLKNQKVPVCNSCG